MNYFDIKSEMIYCGAKWIMHISNFVQEELTRINCIRNTPNINIALSSI